jgi:hypothetical protein
MMHDEFLKSFQLFNIGKLYALEWFLQCFVIIMTVI